MVNLFKKVTIFYLSIVVILFVAVFVVTGIYCSFAGDWTVSTNLFNWVRSSGLLLGLFIGGYVAAGVFGYFIERLGN